MPYVCPKTGFADFWWPGRRRKSAGARAQGRIYSPGRLKTSESRRPHGMDARCYVNGRTRRAWMGLTAVHIRLADAGGLEIHGRPWPTPLKFSRQAIAKWKRAQKR